MDGGERVRTVALVDGIDIQESKDVLVLIDLSARDLSTNDSGEDGR